MWLENCSPPSAKESTDKKISGVGLEECVYHHAQALKMILQSVDSTNRITIKSCLTTAKAYEALKSRYGMKDTAFLVQLLSQLFALQNMKQCTVTEKYDVMINITSQITDQEKEAMIQDIVQAVILMRSFTPDVRICGIDRQNSISWINKATNLANAAKFIYTGQDF